MEKKTIGAFIAVLRKANGMTQKELAEKLNVSDKTVSRWERDECAPDLSLIPVIADLFHVTTDELLRGERRSETAEQPRTEARSEKQMNHLLQQSRTTYLTRSILSAALAVLGLLAAMICNFAFNRAYLGFYIGCIFFAAASVCQTIFTIRTFLAVSAEEFDGERLTQHRGKLMKILLWSVSIILILFAFTLPLTILVWDAYFGLTMSSWATHGLLYAAIAAAVCAFACWLILRHLGAKGIVPRPAGWRGRTALLVKTILVVVVILFVIQVVQGNLNSYLCIHKTFYEGTSYESFEAFKEVIETEQEGTFLGESGMSSNVEPLESIIPNEDEMRYVLMPDGSTHSYFSTDELEVLGLFDGYIGTYRHLNQQIVSIDVVDNVITTYDQAAIERGDKKGELLNIGFLVLDILTIGGGVLFYLRKRKKA